MAAAGVTHDITLNNQGFMLAQLKSGSSYVRESMPGYQTAAAAISTNGTESLDSPDGYGLPASKVHRVYFDEWRGLGRSVLTGGSTGKPSLSGPRGNSIDVERTSGGSGGLVQDLVNLRPLMGGTGLGVAPWPYTINSGIAASDFAAVEYKGDIYLVEDTTIYTATVDADSNFNGLVATGGAVGAGPKSIGFDATGSAWVCFGTTPRLLDNPAVSYPVAGPTDFMCTFKGVTVRAYTAVSSHGVVYIDLSGVNIYSIGFNAPIRALCVHDGAVWVGADDGLYRITGNLRASDPAFPNVLNQFEYSIQQVIGHSPANQSGLGIKSWRSLISFDGALWGAVDGHLVKVGVKGGGFNFQLEQQPIPPGWVWSMVVAAGQLFVSIQVGTEAGVATEIYVFDPAVGGWWGLASDYQNLTYLFSGGTVVKNSALFACHDQEAAISYCSFDATNPSGLNTYNYHTAGTEGWNWDSAWVTLPLITPDDLAALYPGGKQGLVKLLKIGVEWDTQHYSHNWRGWPDLDTPAGMGNLFFDLLLSTDEAISWQHLANAMGTQQYYIPGSPYSYTGRTDWLVGVAQQVIKPVSQIGQGAPAETDQNGNGWLIRLNYTGMPGPLIRRLFVDYQVLEFNPQIGNRWKLALDLSYAPDAVRLDGQAQDIPAPINFFGHIYTQADAVALTLAEYWSSGTALNFGDINGQDGHNVKIVSYKIERAAPGRFPALASDGGTLQQNYIMWIELVEVIE